MQSAVLRALETPNAWERYLQGEAVFAGCLPWGAADDGRKDRAIVEGVHRLLQLEVPRTPRRAP
jgi:hypothetical protein